MPLRRPDPGTLLLWSPMTRRVRQKLEYLVGAFGPIVASILLPRLLWRVDTEDRRILYLTFDDGPTQHLTPRILDVLGDHDARASFFLLGKNFGDNEHIVQRMIKSGHSVGLHGFNHLDPWKTDEQTILADISRAYSDLTELMADPPRVYRPPYGRFTWSLERWCSDHNMRVVMWDVMPGDFMAGVGSDVIASRIRWRMRPGSIIVLHDSHNPNVVRDTVPALEQLIPELANDGWRFHSLEEALQ